jgi:predicted CXXCH cytochrome family protein
MKLFKFILFILLVSLLLTVHFKVSFAQVERSPHDMIAQGFFLKDQTDKKSRCSYCHFSFEDSKNKIWDKYTIPRSLKEYGQITAGCYSCHDGVTIVDVNVDASRTAFSNKSHAFFQKRIDDKESALDVSLSFLEGNPLTCVTCHSPHKNKNRPFLVMMLNELCTQCHISKMNSGFGENNSQSNHPVFSPPLDSTEGPSPISLSGIFNVAFPLPYPVKGGKTSVGTHWDLGGHLTAGDIGNMECFTCHSVHGDELVGSNYDLLTADPAFGTFTKKGYNQYADYYCQSCHRGKRGDGVKSKTSFPNPGGTKGPRTYHPVSDDISNVSRGVGRIVEIEEPEDWPFGKDGEVICITCHDSHNGLPNSPILRIPEGDTFCEECHEENPQGHHPSGESSNPKDLTFATKGYKWKYADEIYWQNGNPKIIYDPDPESKLNGYGKTYGEKVLENKIYCSTCHRAHNAGSGIEKGAAPSLVVSHTANQICVMCHSLENITFNPDPKMTATHFMGDATKPPYETSLDKLDIYKKVWPETGLKSKYGGDNEREIVCETCHSLNIDNLNNNKYSYINDKDMLIARSDETLEWEVELDCHEIEVSSGEGTVPRYYYLCVGCHSEDPGSDGECKSHPMMNIDGKMPDGTIISRVSPPPPYLPGTYTENLFMNCNSCHFTHSAKVEGGAHILKAAKGKNKDPLAVKPADVNYTPLCELCHEGY